MWSGPQNLIRLYKYACGRRRDDRDGADGLAAQSPWLRELFRRSQNGVGQFDLAAVLFSTLERQSQQRPWRCGGRRSLRMCRADLPVSAGMEAVAPRTFPGWRACEVLGRSWSWRRVCLVLWPSYLMVGCAWSCGPHTSWSWRRVCLVLWLSYLVPGTLVLANRACPPSRSALALSTRNSLTNEHPPSGGCAGAPGRVLGPVALIPHPMVMAEWDRLAHSCLAM